MPAADVSPEPARDPAGPRRPRAPRLVALAAFVLLAIVHTWPLASNPAHLSRNNSADALLNTWAIAWVAHQLPRDPVHLFDANIFYPERLTLGYSEAMIVQGVMAMPILAMGGSAVLAFNLVLMAGFALTGWAFCLLLRNWTGSWAAGYVGGSLAAFNSHALVRLPHLQAQHVEFFALMLFALDRLISSRRVRDALWLGVAFALQGLTSVYLLVFSTWAMLFAVAGRGTEWLRQKPGRTIGLFAAAGATATILMAPYLAAYYELHRLTRHRAHRRRCAAVRRFMGATISSTGARAHFALWSNRPTTSRPRAPFPVLSPRPSPSWRSCGRKRGATPESGCASSSRSAAWRCRCSPTTPIYPFLHRFIPLFRAVRVQAHIATDRAADDRRRWPASASPVSERRCAGARMRLALGRGDCARS